MDKETIQYLEGKHEVFLEMKGTLETILTLLEGKILIIDSEQLNKEYFEKLVSKSKKFVP
jgi:hypothetical protein